MWSKNNTFREIKIYFLGIRGDQCIVLKEQGTTQTLLGGSIVWNGQVKPVQIFVHITLSISKDSGKPEQIHRLTRAVAYRIHEVKL